MKDLNVNMLQLVLLSALLAIMSSCNTVEAQKSPATSPTEADQTTEFDHEKMQAPMNLHGQTQFSIKDLAQRLDVPPESVKVSGARQVTWRSGALGCPEPGMNYTEALVPGAVIYLQVDNMIHAYHAKFAGEPFYCPRERVEQPALEEGLDLT